MFKKDIHKFWHGYLQKQDREFVINTGAFVTDSKGEITLSEQMLNVLRFAGENPEALVEALKHLITMPKEDFNSWYTTCRCSLEDQQARYETGIIAGMLDLPIERAAVFSPWYLVGYMAIKTPENIQQIRDGIINRSSTIADLATKVGLSIADARVLYLIDNNEDLFDCFGYIAGGETVFEALITEERAARIPRIPDNEQVLAWCIINNKIKENFDDMPFNTLLSIAAEDMSYVESLSEENKKKVFMTITNTGSGLRIVRQVDITRDFLNSLKIQDVYYLYKREKELVLKNISDELFSELLYFAENIDQAEDSDNVQNMLSEYFNRDNYVMYRTRGLQYCKTEQGVINYLKRATNKEGTHYYVCIPRITYSIDGLKQIAAICRSLNLEPEVGGSAELTRMLKHL